MKILIATSLLFFGLFSNDFDYNGQWKKVDELINQGKPKSALVIVDDIYKTATKAGDDNQAFRAIIYKHKLSQQLEEIEQATLLNRLIADCDKETSSQIKALLQSVTGELLIKHLRNNYYRLKDRVTTAVVEDDVKLWSVAQIEAKADDLILQSLQHDVTKVELESYALMFDQYKGEYSLRTFLLHQAIRHFSDDITHMTGVKDASQADAMTYFVDSDIFLNLEIDNTDRQQRTAMAMSLYQKLMTLLKQQKQYKAFAKINVKRLQTLKQKQVLSRQVQEKQYADILRKEIESAKGDVKAVYQYYYATWLNNEGSRYPSTYDQSIKGYKKDAHDLLSTIKTSDKEINSSVKSLIKTIEEEQQLSVELNRVVISNMDDVIKVDWQNVPHLYFKIVKIDKDEFIQSLRGYNQDRWKKYATKKAYKSFDLSTQMPDDFQQYTSEVMLPSLPLGQYVLVASASASYSQSAGAMTSVTAFQVSNLTVSNLSGANQLMITDRRNGTPVSDVNIKVHSQDYRTNKTRLIKDIKSNRSGIAIYNKIDRNNYFVVTKNNDVQIVQQNLYSNNHNNRGRTELAIFLDRAIYRPGQSLLTKVLVIRYDKEGKPHIEPNQKATLILRDANHQEVIKREFVTNAYGAFNADIALPTDGLKGNYHIEVNVNGNYGHKSFKMEEYRRPTQEITFDTITQNYKLGDDIALEGKLQSYSGFPAQDAEVTYTIYERPIIRPYFGLWCGSGYYMPYYGNEEIIIATDKTTTDAKGKFEINFSTNTDANHSLKRYRIVVNAVHQSGEQISETKSIRLSKSAFTIKHNLSNVIFASDDTDVTIDGKNLEGKPIPVTASFEIKKVKDVGNYAKKREYRVTHWLTTEADYTNSVYAMPSDGEPDWDEQFGSKQATSRDINSLISDLPQGQYLITITAKDADGNTTNLEVPIVKADTSKCVEGSLGYTDGSIQLANVGEQFEPRVLLGCDVDKVYVMKLRGGVIISEEWMTMDTFAKRKYDIGTKDMGGFSLYYIVNRYGDQFVSKIDVDVPYQDQYFDIDLTVDEIIQPNTKTSIGYQITIDGKPKPNVSVSTVMYDASLDAIAPNRWKLEFMPRFYGHMHVSVFNGYRQRGITISEYKNESYSYLNLECIPYTHWYGLGYGRFGYGGARLITDQDIILSSKEIRSLPSKNVNAIMRTKSGISKNDGSEVTVRGSRSDVANYYVDGVKVNADASNDESMPEKGVQKKQKNEVAHLRSNFAETVFFERDLVTDGRGKATYTFTSNDAITKWKLMTFAYDKDMRYGFTETTIVSKKDIQIIQNPTRTLQEGDRVSWPITVQNSQDKPTNCKVSLDIISFTDGTNLNEVFGLTDDTASITLDAMGEGSATFDFEVPESYKDAIYVVANVSTASASDSERRMVPILSSDKFINEGHNIWLQPNETKMFAFEGQDVNPFDAKIELATNPLWLVARSFPMMQNNDMRITSNVINKLYIDRRTSTILQANPNIEKAYASGKIQDEKSGLSRNEDLKNQTLTNTPWVQVAQSEDQRAANLANYFNQNAIDASIRNLTNILTNRQNYDGGFPWIDGGRSNLYITMDVLTKLLLLDEEGIDQQLIRRVVDYVNTEVLKEWKKELKPSKSRVLYQRYAYIQSMLPKSQRKNGLVNDIVKYLRKDWVDKHISQQALIGLIALNLGEDALAADIKASLLERAITRDDGTVTWRGINEFYAYANAYQVQTAALAFLAKTDTDRATIDKGTQWLIANKRGNRWYNNAGTVDVVDFLIKHYGIELSKGKTTVSVNGTPLTLEETLTYSQADLGKQLIQRGLNVEVTNDSDYPIFGGVFMQYFQDIDDVKTHQQSKLAIGKEILKKVVKGNTISYKPIDGQANVGDELVVRLTVSSKDRLNFVHVSDTRLSGAEPATQISKYDYSNGMYYYSSPNDAGHEFFISTLPRGTFTLEYPIRVTQAGKFSGGLAQIQSYYVPEIASFDSYGEVETFKADK